MKLVSKSRAGLINHNKKYILINKTISLETNISKDQQILLIKIMSQAADSQWAAQLFLQSNIINRKKISLSAAPDWRIESSLE